MSMNLSLQTVAQNSRATLDMLNAQASEGVAKGRIGIRKDGQITVFKGMEFVLHLRQCHRAKALLKAHELIAERKSSVASLVSSLKLNSVRLDKRPVSELIFRLNRSNETDRNIGAKAAMPVLLTTRAESVSSIAPATWTGPAKHGEFYLTIMAEAMKIWDKYRESAGNDTPTVAVGSLSDALPEAPTECEAKPTIPPKCSQSVLQRNISCARMVYGDPTPVYTANDLKAERPMSPARVESMQRYPG
ncbi:hypothetical protein [Pandoraea oxalativorans]|uniref:Uncharacterized protein n=1 Tax=Pandoraea oxalativorans TaxID=573737 RepID=A0A0E3YA19_9BURK|nr:hypothetical protein [Pandoraea oxalativorans]AKC69031.1 hypothetical protein MB84_05450 [Pandoraea oxalativorans]